jgi:hypothetical protein
MYELSMTLLFLLLMVGCYWGGLVAQRCLHETHRSQESIDSIRMVITLLVTFAAVVLGLLISSSETRFSAVEAELRGLSINITELDQRLREYGPAVDPLRADLILYTKSAIADTWPEETMPPGDYPHHLNVLAEGSVESIELGATLNRIDLAIRRLAPDDEFHRSMADSLRNRMIVLLERRWNLIENGQPSLALPFLEILMFWLAIIFVIAGLSSPRNLVVFTVTTLAAISVASALFLTLELDSPLSGFIKISSAPLRDTLLHLTASSPPASVP